MKKRDTVGKISSELIQKEAPTRDPIALEREMHKEYEVNVLECVEIHKKMFNSDFYVVVLTRRDRLMKNVIRHQYFGRESCPSPDFDQTVYKYHKKEEAIEFLWVIPSQDVCHTFRDNALIVTESERPLLNFVLEFSDGTLYRRAKQLNGEAAETSHIINKPIQFSVNSN